MHQDVPTSKGSQLVADISPLYFYGNKTVMGYSSPSPN